VIPIQDVVPTRRTPVVTVVLAGLNILVFVYGLVAPLDGAAATVLTLFEHSGIAHVVFNVMFLWLFGDNVEDRLGRGGLVVCYLACGVVGTGVQAALARSADLPAVGASAAIAGVIGAYFVLLPRSKVLLLVPIPLSLVEVPAAFFLAMFGLVQFLNFVVLPAAARLDSSPTAALAALALSFGCGAALAVSRRRPVIW
jgi:membrane associated rhomboid family serine protease